MASKLYDSKEWLRYQHHTKGKSIEYIAMECKVTPMTIRRAMERHRLRIMK